MTGVIWLVQGLVYPNFRLIEPEAFRSFHHFHTNRITWIVAPVMLFELITGVWLYAYNPSAIYFWNLISISTLWILTGFLNVPVHRHLELFPEAQKTFLVWSNWPRTLTWTLRSAFWLWFLNRQGLDAI